MRVSCTGLGALLGLLGLLGLAVVGIGSGTPAWAGWTGWTDTASATGSISTQQVDSPDLTCTTSGVLATSATVRWRATAVPTLLGYAAVVPEDGSTPSIVATGDQRSVTIDEDLLSTLLGRTVTLRIKAFLPGTGWTATSEQTLSVGLAGVGVRCA